MMRTKVDYLRFLTIGLLLILFTPIHSGSKQAHEGRTHLGNQKSPYLLQHTDNLIEWYPWGPEAFEKARKEHKPIFLSIGYSSCHWCHVMEEESFHNPEVAHILNATFVNILVDREERPDIDALYMRACLLLSGSCGWPLNVFMTPEGKPFFVTTYLPPRARSGRIGLIELAQKVQELWNTRRDALYKDAARVFQMIRQIETGYAGERPNRSLLTRAYEMLARTFDSNHGGFGTAPKFPQPHQYLFLMRYYNRTHDPNVLQMVKKSLNAMMWSGLYDQLEGGFFRYATDAQWRVPHFEKMLVDQALLLMTYTEAFQLTRDPNYKSIVFDMLHFLQKNFRSDTGGYFTALDADSEGKEGRYYVWSDNDLEEALTPALLQQARIIFDLAPGGDIRSEEYPGGVHHLYFAAPPAELARRLHMTPKAFQSLVHKIKQRLEEARRRRTRPNLDDKILTNWNGWLMAAMALAGRAFQRKDIIKEAMNIEHFIHTHLRDPNGQLFHRYYKGHAGVPGLASDYAAVIFGLIHLYQATFDPVYLKRALVLQTDMDERFGDPETGGYFEQPRTRTRDVSIKNVQDSAYPSTNSLAFCNLMMLARLTGKIDYQQKAEKMAEAFGRSLRNTPIGHLYMLTGLDLLFGPTYEIVVAGRTEDADTHRILTALQTHYLPQAVILFRPEPSSALDEINPYVRNQRPIKGKPTIYVCQAYICKRPTTRLQEALQQIDLRWPRKKRKGR